MRFVLLPVCLLSSIFLTGCSSDESPGTTAETDKSRSRATASSTAPTEAEEPVKQPSSEVEVSDEGDPKLTVNVDQNVPHASIESKSVPENTDNSDSEVVLTSATTEVPDNISSAESVVPLESVDKPNLRSPSPTDEELNQLREKVQEILKSEYTAARTREKQNDLAMKLKELSEDFDEDDPVRMAMLDEAMRFALKSTDWKLAVSLVDELGSLFEINQHDYHLTVMSQAARTAEKDEVAEVSALALEYSRLAADDEAYDKASRLTHAALTAARRADGKAPIAEAVARSKEIGAAKAAFEKASAARIALQNSPDDPVANESLGTYLAIYREDWKAAVPHLAIAGSNEWKQAASLELSESKDAAAQVQLAEAWLKIADGKPEQVKLAVEKRARAWLEKALPHLNGLEKLRVTKLLASVTPEEKEKAVEASDTSADKQNGTRKIVETRLAGGNGGGEFRWVAPEGATFVGIRVSSTTPISMVQPIYLKDDEQEFGPVFGEAAETPVTLLAQPNYKVAGLSVKIGDFVKGLTVTFAETKPKNRLKPKWYESQYIGEAGPGEVVRLGSPDLSIVGIFGRGEILIDAVGLLGTRSLAASKDK